jgi:hypothetical protein
MYDNGEVNIATLVSTAVAPDAVDFYYYWKLWDALMDCALSGTNCDVAFGDTHQQKFMGLWSDGTPVTPLVVIPASTTTAVGDVKDEIRVSVFPNPISGNDFQLSLNSISGDLVFQLYDIDGRKISEQKITTTITTMKCELQSSVYFYQVKNTTDGTLSKGKLVVQR